ncbi:MAG: TIGR03564 family F420-dependent LLM class oxidoreductase [Gammaproteobacteria bacterium]|nr:TIGR03564 family F420-dependent LLM class oxidoreductase [Gammaproteobacteria bacterium]
MRIGIMLGATPDPDASIDKFIATAKDMEARGFSSLWLAHIRGHDALMAMAMAARETTHLEVGTAVTPIQPRHPMALAQQALTAQAMARGRFTLGVGLSHKRVIEDMLGLSYAQPANTMREYLDVLMPLLNGEEVRYEGEKYRVQIGLDIADASTPVPTLVAALGPQMLKVAGSRSDGTVLWMTGPTTISQHIVPNIQKAATEASRSAPRIVAGFPVVLTNDEAGARETIAKQLQVYGQLPSYRAMLDREGVNGPGELALVGGENALAQQLTRVAQAGATDLVAVALETDPGSQARTLDFLQSRLP